MKVTLSTEHYAGFGSGGHFCSRVGPACISSQRTQMRVPYSIVGSVPTKHVQIHFHLCPRHQQINLLTMATPWGPSHRLSASPTRRPSQTYTSKSRQRCPPPCSCSSRD